MTATEVGTGRFDVRSADGTPLAVWVDGDGPPLVLVHGSLRRPHHLRPAGRRAARRPDHLLDGPPRVRGQRRRRRLRHRAGVRGRRRGGGAVAARTGGPVALWGHSYGAGLRHGRGRPDGRRPPPGALRARSRHRLPARFDRGDRGGGGRGRPGDGAAGRAGRDRRGDRGGDRRPAVGPPVAGPARRRPDGAEGVPGRGRLGATGPACSTGSRPRPCCWPAPRARPC